MEFSTIKYEEPMPGLGWLTLHRPDSLNSMSLDMIEELQAFFDELRRLEEVRVLVITGAGRGFCSGADLHDGRLLEPGISSGAAAHLVAIQKKASSLILAMRRLPQPIISAVNGPAAGGGMCMVLASDIIIAGPGANFTASFINIGLSGGELGTTYFLPRLVGSARASEILLTGRTVGAVEAEKIGLVSRLVEEHRLKDEAMETARVLLGKSVLGLRLTKEALNQNLNAPSLESAIDLEDRNQSICVNSPEALPNIEAFKKKNA